MAAYAALVSLMHLIEQIKHHPQPPLSLDEEHEDSLTKKVCFLQRFLEDFHARGFSQEIQALEGRIADAAHAAEDVIESHGVDQILLASGPTTADVIEKETSTGLFEGLQRVIQDMELVEKEAMDTMKKKKPRVEDGRQLPQRRGSARGADTTAATAMVGFDETSIHIMERLTGNQSRRDIIPIVGMGGAGKTTLARNIYERPLIVEHFHSRSWATISQECVVREVLIEILLSQSGQRSAEELSQESEEDLGDQLYKSLFGKKYLIVMDDVWSIEAWEKLRLFFPDNNNGSRVMITSRLSKLAFDLIGSPGVEVSLLDEDTSWDLLCQKVSAEKRRFPLELTEIGRKIARNCRGLPLSIVTIGGLLAKSDMTGEYWEYVARNLSSLVNSEDGERCSNILSLSYVNLPVHIKPCFLYMGLFREDEIIRASYLIGLWVAEGFLKPIAGKALEVIGEDYLTDLAERNLIVVAELGSTGKIKSFIVHDLLRDLCLREALKERFLSVVRIDDLRGDDIDGAQRRIAIHGNASNEDGSPRRRTPYSAPLLRSCVVESEKILKSISLRSVRLLRILAAVEGYTYYHLDGIVPLVNSRLLSFNSHFNTTFEDISFIYLSWNLQTLWVDGYMSSDDDEPLDIWKMPRLRHIKFKSDSINLSEPPPSSIDGGLRRLVLEDLRTLSKIKNFKCSDEVVERIPNVRKLSICYYENQVEGRTSTDYCLDNLEALRNLESLAIEFCPMEGWWNWFDGLRLPRSLKKLTLQGTGFDWDDEMIATIGSLPFLEVLKLEKGAFVGDDWSPVEGQFLSLRYLGIGNTNLKRWNADSTHFPCLEQLRILGERCLEEVPWGFGDIPTLRLIDLADVRESTVVSAKKMLVEQEEQLGNDTLHIRVMIYRYQSGLESLASHNFKMERILSCTVM